VQQSNPYLFPGQGSGHENHSIAAATNALAVMAEVCDHQIAAQSNREIDHDDLAASWTAAKDAC
jgi:hypothetical protein